MLFVWFIARLVIGRTTNIKQLSKRLQGHNIYPCFDSYDYADKNRYYQMFYLTDSILKVRCICDEDEQRSFVKAELYPIINPEYNPEWIHERHLPFIYYRGEGHILFLVQSRKAGFKDKVRTYDPTNTLLLRLRRCFEALFTRNKKVR